MSLNIPSPLISNNECLYYIPVYHQQRLPLVSLLFALHSFSCLPVIYIWIYVLWIYHLSLSGVCSSGSMQQWICTMAPLVPKGHPNKCISSTSSRLQFLPQSFCCLLPIFLAGLPSCQLIPWAIQHSFNKLIFSFY